MSTRNAVSPKALNRRVEKYTKVTITSAQLLALNATPITVLAAPIAGFTHVINSIYATKAAGTAYTIGSNAGIDFKYTNSSGAVVATLPTTGFLDQSGIGLSNADSAASVIPVAAAVVVAQSKTAEVTAGTSPINIRIYYRTLPTAL